MVGRSSRLLEWLDELDSTAGRERYVRFGRALRFLAAAVRRVGLEGKVWGRAVKVAAPAKGARFSGDGEVEVCWTSNLAGYMPGSHREDITATRHRWRPHGRSEDLATVGLWMRG